MRRSPYTTVLRASLAIPTVLWPATAAAADGSYRLDGGQIFTLLFVTLGPLKILGPFARLTRAFEPEQLRRLAWRSAAIAALTLLVGGFLGRALLGGWGIPPPVLQVTGGLVFFVVALGAVLAPYQRAAPATPPSETPPSPLEAVLPLIVTPYGMAAVIMLLALSSGARRTGLVLGVLLVVMLANLAAMLWVRHLMTPKGVAGLQLLGAVLGILQVALALWILLAGFAGVQRLASS